jgi:hypothetical protein
VVEKGVKALKTSAEQKGIENEARLMPSLAGGGDTYCTIKKRKEAHPFVGWVYSEFDN